MKPGRYLNFYFDSLEKGEMVPVEGGCYRTSGLCDAFEKDELFKLIKPTNDDLHILAKENKSLFTWASGTNSYNFCKFTPLRQNIVLLMACLNNEL